MREITPYAAASRVGFAPDAERPGADYRALRWPAAAALMAVALLLWRIGMDGVSAEALLAHAAFCLGAGPASADGVAVLFGHCAACYAAASAAAAGMLIALWPAAFTKR